MYAHVKKLKENSSSANMREGKAVAQKKSNGKQGFGFVDNRPEMVEQRKLEQITNNSSKTMPLQLTSPKYTKRRNRQMSKQKAEAFFKRNANDTQLANYKVQKLKPMVKRIEHHLQHGTTPTERELKGLERSIKEREYQRDARWDPDEGHDERIQYEKELLNYIQ